MDEKENHIMILDEIMVRVRKIALENNTSVSDIVHEALGEYLYHREPGINYYDIIYGIEASISEAEQFTVNTNLPNFTISIKSPLKYSYRPTLRYEIEIKRDGGTHIGRIRTILRSNDIYTIKSFSDFLNLWVEIESRYVGDSMRGYAIDTGFFSRNIYMPKDSQLNARTLGGAIGEYIHVFDRLFKHYFNHPGETGGVVENMYIDCIKCGKLIV